MASLEYNYFCIPVRGRIKETTRVDNLGIPQRAGWITTYPPVVWQWLCDTIDYMIYGDTNVKYKLGDNSDTISGIV